MFADTVDTDAAPAATYALGAPPVVGQAQTVSHTPALGHVQRSIADYILDRPRPTADTAGTAVASLVREQAGVDSAQRLGIYHNAYRARLVEVLADSFAKTYLYMGSDTFDHDATAFAVSHPPMTRSLSRYGTDFPAYLAALYPENPELFELAQLDWDLRTRFDGADVAALNPQTAQAGADEQAPQWLSWRQPLHPSLTLRCIRTNVAQIWRAIDTDTDVPPVQHLLEARFLAVWRKGLQPHFQSLDADEAAFMQNLLAGNSVDEAANALAGTDVLPDPQRLGGWLQAWLADGVLRQHGVEPALAAH
ncbi:MAG: DNA-binding domain-containing protein [Pseudomonadota bacterium]